MVFLPPHYRQGVKANSSIQVSLLQFAAAGNATAELDIVDESVQRYRYFYSGNSRRGIPDQLVEGRTFAKYIYRWGTEYFIVYIIAMGYTQLQYILKEPAEGETVMSGNGVTDKLIASIGVWQKPDDKYVYVYDGYWQASSSLYKEVQKANWEDVILNEEMKKTITGLMHKFFDSEDIYKDLGVPWKRGVIFYGPAGNGKTISIKALMHSLFKKNGDSIPSLYVKAAPNTWDIRSIFSLARYMAPCLLIFEDIDTIVTPGSRSYFFNEVDGLGMSMSISLHMVITDMITQRTTMVYSWLHQPTISTNWILASRPGPVDSTASICFPFLRWRSECCIANIGAPSSHLSPQSSSQRNSAPQSLASRKTSASHTSKKLLWPRSSPSLATGPKMRCEELATMKGVTWTIMSCGGR